MKQVLYIASLLCALQLRAGAQQITDIEKLLEANDISTSEKDYEDMVTTLLHLAAHPLNLNTVGFDSLKMLFFLSDAQIDNLLAFRARHGGFRHPNELLLVTGIGKKDLNNILPFIHIGAERPLPGKSVFPNRIRQTLLVRVKTTRPLQAGYRRYSPDAFMHRADFEKKEKNRFQGPPWGSLVKYRFEAGRRLQVGFTGENDPGEAFGGKTGFDFLSAHVSLTGDKFLQQMIVGDYKLQFGQGLVAWQGFSSGKSGAVLNNEKSANAIRPYTSSDENNYLRGTAITLRPHPRLRTTLFVSFKKTDGNLRDRDTLDPQALTSASLYETGYHRNLNEQEKKHALKEFTTGLSANLNHRLFRLGINTLYYNFTPQLAVGERLYQQYNDDGQARFLASIDYKTRFRRLYLFGETAISDRGAIATLNGLRYSGWSRAAACLIYRRYDKKFNSHYNGAFAEYSNTSNEEGLYLGIESSPVKNLRFTAYYDRFRFFAPRYRATIPGRGQEYLGEILYTPGCHECSLYFKHEAKPEDHHTAGQSSSIRRIKKEWRVQITSRIHPSLQVRTRFSHARYRKADNRETGFLVYQDIVYTSPRQSVKAQLRVAYFDTDSYNTRIYAYEHNVLYGYSFPAYYDRGFRSYLNLNWKPYPFLTLYMKGGVVRYPDRESISSSLTRVDDNQLFDFTFQVRIKL